MPETLRSLIDRLLTRLMSLWVKPDVLPDNPTALINPELPVLYILEVGGAADRAALAIVTKRLSLPDPAGRLAFGPAREGVSVDVLQQRKGAFFRKHRPIVSRRLSRLVAAGLDQSAGELQIVPVSVYWGRAPDRESSIVSLAFSENWQIAGRTRKLITTLIHGRHTLLSISEPLSFNTLKSSGENADILTRKLSRILRVHFRQRRIASLGPDQSHRRMLIDHVLADTAVRKAINVDAKNSSMERVRARARKYAYEISADVSYPTIRILHKLLRRLWNELYDGVELNGIDRLKAVADGREIIYVPCHRSHIDYLLLSYILYVQGFSIPHIAAGVNLNLPVVGGLLRRGGAFFLRRSFAGKPLYSTVFNAYLKELLQRGHALEYFVEGGRSRTGRLLPPKGGMLAMTIHAYLTQPQTPVVFVPVYFGYERLLEGRAFTSELAGGKKQRESIFALLKSLRTLKEDYGRVHVSFGDPIELNSLLQQHRSDWRSMTVSEERPAWIKPVVDELGTTIMHRINEAASVTPISLLATTILATPRGCISHDELGQQIDIYQRFLKGAYASSLVSIPEVDARELIEHGERLGFIQTSNDDVGAMIEIRAGQAAPLTYFRNNILHLLTLPALVAACFTNQKDRSDQDIEHLVALAFPVIQGELFSTTELGSEALTETLDGLAVAGLILRQDKLWTRASAGTLEAVALQRLANVVTPALERDFLCACFLAHAPNGHVQAQALAKQCQLAADRLARTHGMAATELYDKHLHNAFVQAMHKRGYINYDDEQITATPALFRAEDEARAMLSAQTRHAIIAASRAVLDSNDIHAHQDTVPS
ncbi:MAG: glycerol-3-phosphate 1-O-acyltransferase PlsB [Granulosicoccus sp.]